MPGFDIRSVSLAEVAPLFEKFHAYKGVSSVSVYCFGVFEQDVLVAAFTWQPPAPGAAKHVCPEYPAAVLALNRMVAVPKENRQLKHISKPLLVQMKELVDRTRWPVLITYSDEGLGHTGHVYKCSGWTKTHRVLAQQYVNKEGVRTSKYTGGRTVTGGLSTIGSHYIQRWEHWACARGAVEAHVLSAWERQHIPGKYWRSGQPAFRFVRRS